MLIAARRTNSFSTLNPSHASPQSLKEAATQRQRLNGTASQPKIAKDEQKIKLNGDHKAPTVGLVSIDPLRDKRIRAYLDKVDIAVDGQGGSTPMFRTACFLANRCGLSRDDARVYLKYYSETRSDPPWSDKEIEQKLDDAYGPEHYNPIGDFWKQPKNQGVTNNAPGRKETFSEQLEREFNGHQAPQPLPYEPGCDDGSLSMPQIRLPALNRPESQFAAEVGQLLGQRQVLFRLDDRLVEVEQEQFDGELDQFKLARGGLKFRTLTATRAKTWLEQFVQTGIDSKSEDGDGANIFKAKTMSEALARSLLESPQFLKSIPRVARILDVAIPVRTKTGEYVFPKPGFNRELGLFVALDAPPFTKMSCPEAIAVLEKAHAGFCWKNEQSKVHAYARILTPFARGLMGFGERPPLWFFGGNRPRCGGPRTLCGCLGSENFGLERMECWFFCIDGCLLPQAERVTCSLTIVV
jgi:hypothetical protein